MRVEKHQEFTLAPAALADDVACAQSGQHVLLVLERVRQAEDLALQQHLVFRLHCRVLAEQSKLNLEIANLVGNALPEVVLRRVALTITVGVARVARDHGEIALFDACHRDMQVAVGPDRHVRRLVLAVAAVPGLVRAENRDVGDIPVPLLQLRDLRRHLRRMAKLNPHRSPRAHVAASRRRQRTRPAAPPRTTRPLPARPHRHP